MPVAWLPTGTITRRKKVSDLGLMFAVSFRPNRL